MIVAKTICKSHLLYIHVPSFANLFELDCTFLSFLRRYKCSRTILRPHPGLIIEKDTWSGNVGSQNLPFLGARHLFHVGTIVFPKSGAKTS